MTTRTSYPSDLTDAQWHKIAAHFPADVPCPSAQPNKGGRPRQYSYREIVNAIFYQARSGCAWRLLPHDFAPHGSVWGYFRQWRDDGTLQRLHDALRGQVREQAGKEPTPSAMIIDSQTVKTTEKGGHTNLLKRRAKPSQLSAMMPARRSKAANAIWW